ncbi:hypothetical protein CcaverHIS002_0301320 [Cutaneotrichosporon cavernicola]|uniref:CBM1 domain-containing protein n=1 Tax=Cutaneotrichosporon cavernicola TaxID=279322 RepID=A0AA48IGG6_9TREE|nr:uncharacterized protein CcaverHIS019_0301280 [Cutaneotrichosporon cavernicola]BEI82264.1 hypothetical protein CcaverHIS002_0301320 [Cutaneotrichosporon cavernicola]BEI90058.1 hypothetical protein CcaverHIS019_0301280 [Cutaneotrichosporon cavernicola]
MRITALVPLVALLSGAIAAPLPEVVDLAPPDPQLWSWRCGLFGWRCPNRVQNPPTPEPTPDPPTPTVDPPASTSDDPPPQTSEPPPATSEPPTPVSTSDQPSATPSGLPPGCLTENFCPDTDGGQGGDPGNGDGTITYPNGTKPNGNDNRNRRDVEERSADLTPFLE